VSDTFPDPEFLEPRPLPEHAEPAESGPGLHDAREVVEALRARLRHTIVGRDEVVDMIVVALFAGGHVLLEDFPGSGKTMLARALGESIDDGASGAHSDDGTPIVAFRRVQFTPDLLPSDITGVSVFDPDRGAFEFQPGPLFAHVVLADEINRTSPKVQAALLEAMAERQVTVDNVTHRLDPLFLVIATQNPLGMAGTFPLPAPQLDRFLFKIRMTHISREDELHVLATFRDRLHPVPSEARQLGRDEILAAREAVETLVHVAPEIHETLVDIAAALRRDERVALGVSTRALVQAIPALQARAMLDDRDFVSSSDLEHLAVPLLAHRLMLAPGGGDPARIVEQAAREPLEALARRIVER
jgi:MoxR-like ATPase